LNNSVHSPDVTNTTTSDGEDLKDWKRLKAKYELDMKKYRVEMRTYKKDLQEWKDKRHKYIHKDLSDISHHFGIPGLSSKNCFSQVGLFYCWWTYSSSPRLP
jgi:hypothetical protein